MTSPSDQNADRRFRASKGPWWLWRYLKPFYLDMAGISATRPAARALLPRVAARAIAADPADIEVMLGLSWRLQVMGAWYAVARDDSRFSKPVHEAFDRCDGALTAPEFLVAALVYPRAETEDVIRAYRGRAVEHQFGGVGLVDAALRRLNPGPDAGPRTADDDELESLLHVAQELQIRAAALRRCRGFRQPR